MGPTHKEYGSLRGAKPASPSHQHEAPFQDFTWQKSNTEFRESVNDTKHSICPSTAQLQNSLQMPSVRCMVERRGGFHICLITLPQIPSNFKQKGGREKKCHDGRES